MKLIITLNILLSTGCFLSAQNYESIFGKQSTQWNMTIGNLWGMGSTEHTVSGDTLINGKKFRIIDGYYHYEKYLGFLREDTVTGKAWYCNSMDTTEVLTMDMNLNIGDLMYIGGNWNPHPGNYKVDSVYYLNNRKHIRFNFIIPFIEKEPFVLIEGISSNMGFRFQDGQYINNFIPKLLCSYKNGKQIYSSGPCEIPIQGIDGNRNENKIEIFPNPVSDIMEIQILDNKDNNRNKYKITDIYGNQILSGGFGLRESLDLAKLAPGIYFVIVSNANGSIIYKKKIIKE